MLHGLMHIQNLAPNYHSGTRVCCNAAGDSLTRYQYLSLAYFLSTTHHVDRFGKRRGYPSLVIEREHPDWDTYYLESNAALEHSVDGCGSEWCLPLLEGVLAGLARSVDGKMEMQSTEWWHGGCRCDCGEYRTW